MRIAGTLGSSMVNGDGIRCVVFLQGCAHGCPGCHNPVTWDFNGGYEVDPKVRLPHLTKFCFFTAIVVRR